jgi:hypothetical protein
MVWSQRWYAYCNGQGDVFFSLAAEGFGRGQGTLELARAGRGACWRVVDDTRRFLVRGE